MSDVEQTPEAEDLATVVARLDAAAPEVEHVDLLGDALGHAPEGTPSASPLLQVKWAFGLYLIRPQDEEKRQQWSGPYAPRFSFANGAVSPAPLDTAAEDTLACWKEALDLTSSPLVAARLADLLWERRAQPQPHLHARRAIQGYLDSSATTGKLHALDRGDGLERAMALAAELRDTELEGAIAGRMYGFAADEIAQSSEPRPGVSVPLLSILIERRLGDQDDLSALHAAAWKRYDAAHVRDELAALGAALARQGGDQEAERTWHRQQVEVWVENANNFEGLARVFHLEKAHEIATNFGFTDRAKALLVEIQEVPRDDASEPISASVEVPVDEIAEWIDGLLEDATWQTALQGFGSLIPTDHERDLANAREIMSKSLASMLFTSRVIDDNVTVRVNDTPEKEEEFAHIQQERIVIDFHMKTMYGRLLDRIIEDIGLPGADEIAEFFESPIVYPAVATRVGRAFDHYRHHRYEECVCVLMPWLEAAIRRLCVMLRIPVAGPPRGKKDGGYIGLGALLRSLEGVLDESDRRYLRNLLSDPAGFNLRNRLAHGRLEEVGKFHALATLHVACVLRNYSVNTHEQPAQAPNSG